jgi:hypothetical protein
MAARKFLSALAPLAAVTILAGERPAHAILNYYIYESGSNVIVETAGSLNLPSPTDSSRCSFNGALLSSDAIICTGEDAQINGYALQASGGFGGTAILVPASAVSGISTGLIGNANPPRFYIDPLYVNNTPIISNSTFAGQTLAGLGFSTPGLIGTWNLVSTGDAINVCVAGPGSPCGASPSAVPGPLPLFGAAAAFGYSRRLRRRVSLNRSTSPSAPSISA